MRTYSIKKHPTKKLKKARETKLAAILKIQEDTNKESNKQYILT